MYRHALLLVRLLAVCGVVVNLSTLVANVVQSWDAFNPSYAGFFAKQQLVRPLVGIALSLGLAFVSRPLARLIARGTDA